MWRSCWLASVALLLRLSNCVCFFRFVVECLHHRLAACIFDLGLQTRHCSFLLALLYLPMSLDSAYVNNCNVAIKLKTRQMASRLQTHNAKTDWFCTRNPYIEVIRVSVFGVSPIGYQCLVHGSPT